MAFHDDELTHLEAHGVPPLPAAMAEGWVAHDGARLFYGVLGAGPDVVLLHGGIGHGGNWGYQVPALVTAGYRVTVIDSRGHGRSTRDDRPYSYQLLASDVRAIMDHLQVRRAAIIGWSDGATTGLILADAAPERVAGVFYFACNMDQTGTKPFVFTPVINRMFKRHRQDYVALSATPDDFDAFCEAVALMQSTQPAYSAADLGRIYVPVACVLGEHDEFIEVEHMAYLARTLPDATVTILPQLSHFAPLQRPNVFNATMLGFLQRVLPASL